jgi:hypothetical protein
MLAQVPPDVTLGWKETCLMAHRISWFLPLMLGFACGGPSGTFGGYDLAESFDLVASLDSASSTDRDLGSSPDLATSPDLANPDLTPASLFCQKDGDCTPFPTTPRCDITVGKCVACVPVNDNCPAGKVCHKVNGAWTCS